MPSSGILGNPPQGLLGTPQQPVGLLGDPNLGAALARAGALPLAILDHWLNVGKGLGQVALGAVTLPHDANAGLVDPLSDEGIRRAVDLAGLLPAGAALPVRGALGAGERQLSGLMGEIRSRGAQSELASTNARLYNPPVRGARSFADDYKHGPLIDAAGNLKDIEGRPLGAEYVVGRRVVGGEDIPLAPQEYDAVTKGAIGSGIESREARTLPRRAVGAFRKVAGPDGPEYSLGVLNTLRPEQAVKVAAHEMGHMIDELAGAIPTEGLNTELKRLYNTLNTGQERTRHLTAPQHYGYKGEGVPRELMAEAIRAYMADPNYLKAVAPETAKRIRAYVNANPRLNKTIQFNAAGLPLMPGKDDH